MPAWWGRLSRGCQMPKVYHDTWEEVFREAARIARRRPMPPRFPTGDARNIERAVHVGRILHEAAEVVMARRKRRQPKGSVLPSSVFTAARSRPRPSSGDKGHRGS